jgi:hypothetical protein
MIKGKRIYSDEKITNGAIKLNFDPLRKPESICIRACTIL